jgi:RNA polymerase sigma-70 factor (ECF subfamily)
MYVVAYDILKDSFQAEDSVQQSFINIINYLDKIDEGNEKKTRNFLCIVCKNIAINSYNKNKKLTMAELDERIQSSSGNVLDIVINKENLNHIINSIYKLKPNQQEVMLLRYSHNLSIPEIAALLNIETKTVQKRIERARAKLSELL